MESTMRELSLLEEKSKLWRKHHEEQKEFWRKYYEEEERRLEEEYQRELVKMEEEFEKAAQKMRADFSAKREAVLRQYDGSNVSEGTAEEPIPKCDKTQPQNDCSKTSCPKKVASSSSVQQSVISGDRVCTTHTKCSKTISADSTAVSFISTRYLTSSTHSSNRMYTEIPESESKYETEAVETMVFVMCDAYETCAKQNDSDQHARRRRGRMRGDRHQLKTMLFDPGGYCGEAVERVGSIWVYVPTAMCITGGTVLPSRSKMLSSKMLCKFKGASNENWTALNNLEI
ncbi:uncharacterized protein LOC134284963 [Aedes albopictus]|uniref:Uncharacterized protein n=1 Tax=Aedes albopictus TaxID=7160 RepID=A0ABM1ZHZ5_AEDAL